MTITYGELQNGDRIWIQGYRFTVANVRISSKASQITVGSNKEPNRADVIRFEGIADPDSTIARTSYNGGTYGAYADVSCTIER